MGVYLSLAIKHKSLSMPCHSQWHLRLARRQRKHGINTASRQKLRQSCIETLLRAFVMAGGDIETTRYYISLRASINRQNYSVQIEPTKFRSHIVKDKLLDLRIENQCLQTDHHKRSIFLYSILCFNLYKLIWFQRWEIFVFYGRANHLRKYPESISASSSPSSFDAPPAPSTHRVKPTETDTTISQTSPTCPSASPSGDAWRELVPQTSLPRISSALYCPQSLITHYPFQTTKPASLCHITTLWFTLHT